MTARGATGRFVAVDPVERFWGNVARSTPDACWLWQGAMDGAYGYGAFFCHGKNHRAHRFAYELLVGPIPEGLFVCHSCDNPPCVNPAHLWVGTNYDNFSDMRAKGRAAVPVANKDEACHQAKLTAADVREIRRRRAEAGVPYSALAAAYGVTKTNAWYIVNRRTWRHVA